ncbi:MAG: SusD/RagB family nutrient-binding outer membrane lipoprotein [Dysgonamonadaceae bacterium]|jgi:hypothetical protein|nr:SusD/RagB family nutrient-binding outer membrane lipoprotein [Dysgonamonadaceae bacterium]
MKQYSKYIAVALFALLFLASCMDYEEINTPEYLPQKLSVGAYFGQMQNSVYPAQENAYQIDQNFIGDCYGRYMSISNTWPNHFATFNANEDWIGSPFRTLSSFYPAFIEVKTKTNGEGINFAWAQLLKVAKMQRLTDIYGPIPYSQITGNSITVAYDSQEEVYNHLFEDLDYAIGELTAYALAFPGDKPMADYDKVYGGDFTQWVKFANSLKLRLAMRIVYANPTLAQQKAEEAVNHPIGVIKTNSDNASFVYQPNGIYQCATNWGDTRACADLVSYMNGYNDPRRSAYFETNSTGGYVGLRSGIDITSKTAVQDYSIPKFAVSDKTLWMNAAEVAFLRAEGALRGWNMGGGTAESLYNEGIKLSFEEHAVNGADTYLNDNTSLPGACNDPAHQTPAISTVTIKWNDGDTQEVKLERLITQKWIALWPLGTEAWCDYRRTGYPRFFPVEVNRNTDASLTTVAARIPFEPKEKINNAVNYANAVTLLGGADAYGTRLWWDKKSK